ncbi:DUF7541 family protein [Natronomonas sp. EA1]|uniref:DUF7541 family protein n=1 Tax=Natronomonas sp. EA1 TaxID=3421655 RepID=UPI003EB6CA03
MSEAEPKRASAWPIFVALGLAISEVGVFMGLYPVAVLGLLLFAGSVAGIVHEAGYVETPWKLLTGMGGLFVLIGLGVVASQLDAQTVAAWVGTVSSENTVVLRGISIVLAGVFTAAVSVVGLTSLADPPVGANQ